MYINSIQKVSQIRLSKHDRYVQELCDKIKGEYDSLSKNVLIKNNKRSFGEIDILAKKGDDVEVYEVKCSHRIIKAKHQIKRLRKHLSFGKAYFYCGTSKLLFAL